ncbi:Single-stranded DNA-binding protein 2 [Frankia canadensis]|uniref:Single-stranded DNA-binding protein n=1 Tax=Frankia canadensis TaxID=1836972 RepID=A0A2I2KNK0_9ACTN|nr:single-stranded DNA-binding protein [Frankia canadensis]SNQ47245.1 Single-stranded DNA-binding protein 2 [Frankia canadensis]SOU54535.1 Single-stranded DNA-binding protein 2 [Frankia canadensis]
MLDTTITLVGNLVDDPEHRTTANGASVCTFRLASTPRRFDRAEGRWVDGATLFLRVSCWRQLADNVAASLARGDRALVYGRLRQRSFETSEGERRVTYEIDADAVGAELTWHPARSQRLARRVGSQPPPPPGEEADLPGGGPFVDLGGSAGEGLPAPEPAQPVGVGAGAMSHVFGGDESIGVSAIGGTRDPHPAGAFPPPAASASGAPFGAAVGSGLAGADTVMPPWGSVSALTDRR